MATNRKAAKAAPKAAPKAANPSAPMAAPKAAKADAPSLWSLRSWRNVQQGERCTLSNGWTFEVPAAVALCDVQHLDQVAWPIQPVGSVWHLCHATDPQGNPAKGCVLLHANPVVRGTAKSGPNGTWTVRACTNIVLH